MVSIEDHTGYGLQRSRPAAILALFSGAVFFACSALYASEYPFTQTGDAYAFDTSILQGSLKAEGVSRGLTRVMDPRSGTNRAKALGLFSLYRIFDSSTRYGDGRSRASESKLLPNGAVEYRWPADEKNPFEICAMYRWVDAETLDLTLAVTARKALKDFEVYLSSYVAGSDRSFVYAGGEAGPFIEAMQSDGNWQLFPRDASGAAMVQDGRWTREPHAVEWVIRPEFSGAFGLRRNTKTGSTTLVMATPVDCFAVSTPFGTEAHRSLYLSLFGRDIEAGQTDTVRARLVLGHAITDEQAIERYHAYINDAKH